MTLCLNSTHSKEIVAHFHINPGQNCTIIDAETENLLKGVIIFLTMVILILAVVVILLLFTMKYKRTPGTTIRYSYDDKDQPRGSSRVSFHTPLLASSA